MKRSSSMLYSTFLVIGVLFFFLGLLALTHQSNVIGFFSLILPDIQTIELFGVLLQSVGVLLVLYGIMKFVTDELIVKSGKENQAILFSLMQTVERVDRRTTEVVEKLGSIQMANSAPQTQVSTFLKCRFCGSKVDQGSSFCPSCGKSQK
jgi:hypothetical protein